MISILSEKSRNVLLFLYQQDSTSIIFNKTALCYTKDEVIYQI